MVNKLAFKKAEYRCFECGSRLLFVSEETVKPEGVRYAQKNTVYRCSNDICQGKKDKEKTDRLKMRQAKEIADRERVERIQEKKQLTQKLKAQRN